MYIGFVGVSGAGKSTIAHVVCDELIARGYTVGYYSPFFSPGRSIWYKAMWALYLWRWLDVRLLYFFVWQRQPHWVLRQVVWNAYLSLIMSHYLSLHEKDVYDVVIYDEDIIKWCARAVASDAVAADTVAHVYQDKIMSVTTDALVVTVDTPISQSVERFIARAENAHRSKSSVRAEQVELKDAASELASMVATETDAVAVVVDGTESPVENAELIVATVEEKLADRG